MSDRRIIQDPENVETDSSTTPSVVDENSSILSSSKLEQLFNSWIITGKGDLVIDNDLINQVNNYLDYEDRVEKIRNKVANMHFANFLASDSYNSFTNAVVTMNNKSFGNLKIYKHSSSNSDDSANYHYISVRDFKLLACYCGIKSAMYLENESDYIDLLLWVSFQGGTFVLEEGDNDNYYNSSPSKLTITLTNPLYPF